MPLLISLRFEITFNASLLPSIPSLFISAHLNSRGLGLAHDFGVGIRLQRCKCNPHSHTLLSCDILKNIWWFYSLFIFSCKLIIFQLNLFNKLQVLVQGKLQSSSYFSSHHNYFKLFFNYKFQFSNPSHNDVILKYWNYGYIFGKKGIKTSKLMINNNALKHKKLASKSSKKLSQLVLQKNY